MREDLPKYGIGILTGLLLYQVGYMLIAQKTPANLKKELVENIKSVSKPVTQQKQVIEFDNNGDSTISNYYDTTAYIIPSKKLVF